MRILGVEYETLPFQMNEKIQNAINLLTTISSEMIVSDDEPNRKIYTFKIKKDFLKD